MPTLFELATYYSYIASTKINNTEKLFCCLLKRGFISVQTSLICFIRVGMTRKDRHAFEKKVVSVRGRYRSLSGVSDAAIDVGIG